MPNSKARFIILKIVIAVMFAAVIWKLFDLQVLKGEQYYEIANDRMTTNIVEKAPRGEILDRYGTTLVSNKVGYSVVMQKTDVKDEEFNDIIKKLVDIFYSTQCEYYDDLPISFAPYQFKFEDENEDGSVEDEREAWFKNNSHLGKGIEENMSADQIMQAYKEIYKVSDVYSEDEQRRIVGIRYAAEASGLSQTTLFTVADDISVDAVTQIKERQDEFKGIAVINDYIRQYDAPGLATHILGRTGKINAEEYEANKDLGYGYNDIIGKQGIEKWGEQYLRGIDGTTGTTKEVNGKEITVMNDAEPVPGDYIVLTLDSDLQKVAEKSLEDTIQNIRASSGVKAKDGADCDAGSVAVIDVKTGDLLAGASYPTYDMSKFNEDYETLINNDAKPMWNRLVSGLYSPGSTFKPLTAIAALETGNLNVNEIIEDEGIYKFYADYQPTCWIWGEYKLTHGKQNVSAALENSCNYFFYELGYRMATKDTGTYSDITGVERLQKYAGMFGFDSTSGIELPESKPQISDADSIRTAIGQGTNNFTATQLARYVTTLANSGTCYDLSLVSEIKDIDGNVVYKNEHKVHNQLDFPAEQWNVVRQGMRQVVSVHTSSSALINQINVAVAGKTGTAQQSEARPNHALFVSFAPYENPEVTVTSVIPFGYSSGNAVELSGLVYAYLYDPDVLENTTITGNNALSD